MSATTLNGHIGNVSGLPNQTTPQNMAAAAGGMNVDAVLVQLLTADPFPIETLEQIIKVFYEGNKVEKKEAEKVLVQFKEHEAAWTKVDFILTHSQIQQTQFFALQTLEHTIDKQWKVLPRAQCDGIKDFIIGIIVELTKTTDTMHAKKLYLSKLNVILVKIIKHDWPQHWPTALKDIVGAAKSGESICQNNLEILRLLSEDIFDFSEDQMVQRKVQHLKESMCEEFGQVFELCYYVMSNSENEELILTCLRTLLRFTKWIPGGYIFETELIDKLCERLLPHPPFRNETLACLTEICTFDLTDQKAEVKPDYEQKLVNLYRATFQKLTAIIPLETVNIREAYKTGSDSEQKLVSNLAQFLSTIFTTHRELCMSKHPDEVLAGMRYLVQISYVDDMEVFKICLDFWLQFTQKLYNSSGIATHQTPGWGQWGQAAINNPAAHAYADILSMARLMMICKMAKPEEVLVVENDQGEVVREMIKDTDSQAVYQNCKKTLVFLTNLDTRDTERLMQEKLSKQVDDSEWGWDPLNRLCWSIGSISGSMSEEDERRFLVNVIKDLLGLCEQKRGKDNKAIIASNIMYVVGQYPRFLRNHWKFLKTVVNKLFEFMHESHEGVQDMACDTFLKITQKCKRHFVQLQQGESTPFVEEIICTTVQIISDLQPHQVQAFYEAVGYMIAAQTDQTIQAQLIHRYMQLPDQVWKSLIQQAQGSPDSIAGFFSQTDNCRQLNIVLKTNVRACKSIGHPFVVYLSEIYMDMMMIYKKLSEVIHVSMRENMNALREPHVKDRRTIKKEILNLITLWVENCKDIPLLETQFAPNLFDFVVNDFMACPVPVREAEVITCIKAVLVKLGARSQPFTADIFQKIFEPTLNMIKVNEVDFPEHRRNFFQFLKAINEHCFMSLLSLNQEQFKIVLGAIIWGMKQMMAECKETSLAILEKLLENVADPMIVPNDHAQEFYKNYYVYILEHIFEVSTNILHAKANLQQHAILLAYMIEIIAHPVAQFNNQPRVQIRLSPDQDNAIFIKTHIENLLKKHFNNITAPQIVVFIEGIFALYSSRSEFIAHLRDFLIQMKEKRGEDTSDLFLEERMAEIKAKREQLMKAEQDKIACIPGMANPYAALADEELK